MREGGGGLNIHAFVEIDHLTKVCWSEMSSRRGFGTKTKQNSIKRSLAVVPGYGKAKSSSRDLVPVSEENPFYKGYEPEEPLLLPYREPESLGILVDAFGVVLSTVTSLIPWNFIARMTNRIIHGSANSNDIVAKGHGKDETHYVQSENHERVANVAYDVVYKGKPIGRMTHEEVKSHLNSASISCTGSDEVIRRRLRQHVVLNTSQSEAKTESFVPPAPKKTDDQNFNHLLEKLKESLKAEGKFSSKRKTALLTTIREIPELGEFIETSISGKRQGTEIRNVNQDVPSKRQKHGNKKESTENEFQSRAKRKSFDVDILSKLGSPESVPSSNYSKFQKAKSLTFSQMLDEGYLPHFSKMLKKVEEDKKRAISKKSSNDASKESSKNPPKSYPKSTRVQFSLSDILGKESVASKSEEPSKKVSEEKTIPPSFGSSQSPPAQESVVQNNLPTFKGFANISTTANSSEEKVSLFHSARKDFPEGNQSTSLQREESKGVATPSFGKANSLNSEVEEGAVCPDCEMDLENVDHSECDQNAQPCDNVIVQKDSSSTSISQTMPSFSFTESSTQSNPVSSLKPVASQSTTDNSFKKVKFNGFSLPSIPEENSASFGLSYGAQTSSSTPALSLFSNLGTSAQSELKESITSKNSLSPFKFSSSSSGSQGTDSTQKSSSEKEDVSTPNSLFIFPQSSANSVKPINQSSSQTFGQSSFADATGSGFSFDASTRSSSEPSNQGSLFAFSKSSETSVKTSEMSNSQSSQGFSFIIPKASENSMTSGSSSSSFSFNVPSSSTFPAPSLSTGIFSSSSASKPEMSPSVQSSSAMSNGFSFSATSSSFVNSSSSGNVSQPFSFGLPAPASSVISSSTGSALNSASSSSANPFTSSSGGFQFSAPSTPFGMSAASTFSNTTQQMPSFSSAPSIPNSANTTGSFPVSQANSGFPPVAGFGGATGSLPSGTFTSFQANSALPAPSQFGQQNFQGPSSFNFQPEQPFVLPGGTSVPQFNPGVATSSSGKGRKIYRAKRSSNT